MPDERMRTTHHTSADLPPPDDSDDEMEQPGLYVRFINWAAELPWWAIILVVFLVVVLYSMSTSAAYRDVLRFLTDDPQVTTDNLYDAVLIIGEDVTRTGDFEGETQDSVSSVINQLLRQEATQKVETAGFVLSESDARVTIDTGDELIAIAKEDIISEERTETDGQTRISVTYLESETLSGVITEIDDDEIRLRTVDRETVSFDAARILSREVVDTNTCGEDSGPDCIEGDVVRIEREGELLTGELETLSTTNMSIDTGELESREVRMSDVDYYIVATLRQPVNEAAAARPVTGGDNLTIGYFQADETTGYLGDIADQDSVTLPLFYEEGDVTVDLQSYDDVTALLEATASGAVDGMVAIVPGPENARVMSWLEENPDANLTNLEPQVCREGCNVEVKLADDVVTGRIAEETDDAITLVTTEAEYVQVDRDAVLEERKMEPATCALNNLRGCDAGIFLTLKVTFQAYALALVIGLIFGIMRVQTSAATLGAKLLNSVFTTLSTLYVEVVRGIPLLVILLYAGFVIRPQLRDGLLFFSLDLSMEQGAIMGLAFGYGAFIAEIFRAGIQSISRGQMEAARSLGMSYPQAMRHVILPQAIRVVLPPLGNDFIAMLKDSALISVLALPDLLQLGRLHVSRTFRAFEGYNTVAILYLLMTLFLSMLVRIIERRSRLPG